MSYLSAMVGTNEYFFGGLEATRLMIEAQAFFDVSDNENNFLSQSLINIIIPEA